MCGIVGFASVEDSIVPFRKSRQAFSYLLSLSESRGKESSGLAFLDRRNIHVLKRGISASRLLRSREYKRFIGKTYKKALSPYVMMGHSRLITDSLQTPRHENNQPVIKDGVVVIHNGIVVNETELWERYPQLERQYDVDTEIILALIRMFMEEEGNAVAAVSRAFQEIKGAASIGLLFQDQGILICASNNGSMYYMGGDGSFAFASEYSMLEKTCRRFRRNPFFRRADIRHLSDGFGCVVELKNGRVREFRLGETRSFYEAIPCNRAIIDLREGHKKRKVCKTVVEYTEPDTSEYEKEFSAMKTAVAQLRRCTRCVLPETMPFITFDEEGVCNYCRDYQPVHLQGKGVFREQAAGFGSLAVPDCVVGLSGGRDSCYGLHYLVKELGLRPVAFTYDWGMVTDVARRNISRMCGKLGVEHILVSADIPVKLSYIRKNLRAWMLRPALGLIPLFMAGDKQYFYYAQKVRKETRAGSIVLCENLFERTDFKTGFCGVRPFYDRDHVYTLSLMGRMKMAAYYGMHYLFNPLYWNRSVPDTIGAYLCFYFLPRHYFNLYRFVPWDEKEIDRTLQEEYGWEGSGDCATTWRIGDGTASFYNYVYFLAAGLSEHDALRSNQIREGMIERDEALARIQLENVPRYDSLSWYCRRVGVDMDRLLSSVHRMRKHKVLRKILQGAE